MPDPLALPAPTSKPSWRHPGPGIKGRRPLMAVVFLTLMGIAAAGPALSSPPGKAAPAADHAATPQGQPGKTPRATIEQFHETLLAIMKEANNLGFTGRARRLDPAISGSFNTRMMAKIALGRHWTALSPEQRAKFVEAFRQMMVATYAARFDGFSGERFETLDSLEGPRNSTLVQTQLVKPDGEAVILNYILTPSREGWRVVDIHLDGTYSELALKRSEYATILESEGVDSLIRKLGDKAESLRNTK